MDAENFDILSTNSFPAILVCPGSHKHLIFVPGSVRVYKIYLILIIREELYELKALEDRA